jgi:hypothetical protein
MFLVFLAFLVYRHWGGWTDLVRCALLLGSPSLAGLVLFAWFDHVHFNSYLPNAGYRIVVAAFPQFFSKPYLGFLGLLFDRSYGVLPTAPLYVAVAAGLLVLFRRDRWAAAVLTIPCLGYLSFMSFSQVWFGGWSPPGRYAIAGLVLLVPTVALVLNRKSYWLLAIPAVWTLVIDVLFTVDAFNRWPSAWKGYMGIGLLDLFEHKIHLPGVGSPFMLYPSLLRNPPPREYLVACAWLVAYGVFAFWLARTAEPATSVRSSERPS